MPYKANELGKAKQKITEIAYAFWQSRTLFTACELDIFTIIGDHPTPFDKIVEKTNASPNGIRRLLNALCGMELLKKADNYYSNTEIALTLLVKDSKDYMGNIIHMSNLWRVWTTLTDSVISGGPTLYDDFGDKDENWMKHTADSIHWRAHYEADPVLDMIDFYNVKNVLDLGGGTGYFSKKILDRYPNIKITVYDHPRLIKYADEYFASYGISNKIRTIAGGFFDKEFGERNEYDLIFVSHVITEFSVQDIIQLCTKAHYFTSVGGRIVIHDDVINDNMVSPPIAAMKSLNMMLNTLKGDVYTETDLWVMLKESNYHDIDRKETRIGTTIMQGRKY